MLGVRSAQVLRPGTGHASEITKEALNRIPALHGIEKEIRGRPPDERQQVRQARAKPLLDCLEQWFEETLPKLCRKSDIMAAIRYSLSRWNQLLRYSDDGTVEIDNNSAEPALRAVALAEKAIFLPLRMPAENAQRRFIA